MTSISASEGRGRRRWRRRYSAIRYKSECSVLKRYMPGGSLHSSQFTYFVISIRSQLTHSVQYVDRRVSVPDAQLMNHNTLVPPSTTEFNLLSCTQILFIQSLLDRGVIFPIAPSLTGIPQHSATHTTQRLRLTEDVVELIWLDVA